MTPKTASEVNQMMRTVVDEGTGTPAQLGSGIPFAGKTGTASIGATGSGLTQPWFIGFAPADNPKVAIAVTIEKTQGEFGGQVAAPIAATSCRPCWRRASSGERPWTESRPGAHADGRPGPEHA